ncbi:outer membrane protein [Mucilaginibacter lappiensis]|jgi:hypothetical protein|uniref:outer membrane protein n=1 Tax=Mucilaginibacter lappiensis TaxID=354630 RepID=UPI003D1BA037
MKHFYKLLLPALLLPFFSYAQSNYKPGYAITVKGDTLRGFIDMREWATNPRKINFKTTADGNNTHSLGPADISFFDVTGFESYQRHIGTLNIDRVNVNSMTVGRDTSTITDSLFLKVIQKGKSITLYEYFEGSKNHFFVSENTDNKPIELVYRLYDDGGKTVNENGYMRQLYALAIKYNVDNEVLKIQTERADYKLSDIELITGIINRISKKEIKKASPLNKGTIFFVGIGVNVGIIKTESLISSTTYTYSTSVLPRIAAGLNVLANPNVGRFIFRIEAAFWANRINASVPLNGATYNYKLDQYTLSIIPQLLYNFYNTDHLKFYGAAGASLNISRYKDNYVTINYDNKVSAAHADPKVTKGWTSFPLKVGIVLNKKYDLFVSYSASAPFTDAAEYDIVASSIQAGLNYSF